MRHLQVWSLFCFKNVKWLQLSFLGIAGMLQKALRDRTTALCLSSSEEEDEQDDDDDEWDD